MKAAASFLGIQKVRYDYCQFGTPCRKPTTVLVFGTPLFKQHETVYSLVSPEAVYTRSDILYAFLEGTVDVITDCPKRLQVFRNFVAEPYLTSSARFGIY